jgi:hypothetical protein
MVMQGGFAEVQTSGPGKQRSRHVGTSTRLAESRATFHARNTASARRNEGQDYLITRLQIVNTRATFLDFAGGFVT